MDGDHIIFDLNCDPSGGLLEGGADTCNSGCNTGVPEENKGRDTMNYADEIKKNLTGDVSRDIAWLKEHAKTYEGKQDGYLGIRECWKQIAILTMREETA